ncbi:MAG: ABC transporter ATP-binding protein, partial [Acidobacteriota bacterium]|nr:ABC transporter ATP-binding protein [Acidobacteriota bacterium]
VVEKLCSKVVILYRGKVVANDSIDHLRALMRRPSLEDVFTELVRQEDPNHVARDIVNVMKY